ncbi:hypothetical protein PMZ80_002570 [Knufia obscura]|uniref:Uncharacterized protein n=2 Tax=Knufia TaxID=430999 RepID=A0AAN8IK16_9EURO|nr:hypothetical protein PMZ80_002570 [Knufia obscura]KAK5950722.1 hypothetical protein OHC33_008104 [Knufia fluminis]
MPPKRKSDATDAAGPATKKIQTTSPKIYTREEVKKLDRSVLEELFLESQERAQSTALTPLSATSSKVNSSASSWTEDKIKDSARKLRTTIAREIKKQMKWQPSCKTGMTKWSYSSAVAHEDVFYKAFRIEKGGKKWKQKKVPMREFEACFGIVTASVRYNDLRITGEHVNLHWDRDENTFRLAGTYGL